MRILLQQQKTGLFLGEVGQWVQSSAKAMDFVSSSAAIEFCVANKLSGLQMVFKLEDQPYEIVREITCAAEPPAARRPHLSSPGA